MRRNGRHVLLSPTDLDTFRRCRHASALDYRASILGEPLTHALLAPAPRDHTSSLHVESDGRGTRLIPQELDEELLLFDARTSCSRS